MLFYQAGWSFLPLIVFSCELVSIVEQGTHILGVEVFLLLHIKFLTDEGEVKIHLILLGIQIKLVEVTNPLVLNE